MKKVVKYAIALILIPFVLSLGLLLLKIQLHIEIPVISPAARIITGGLAEIIVVPLNIYASIHSHIYNLQFKCDRLVPLPAVNVLVNENQDAIKKIEQIHSNIRVTVRKGGKECPDKAYIEIVISGERDRTDVYKILKGKNFFGVPCRIINN